MIAFFRYALCSLVALGTFCSFLWISGCMLIVGNRHGGDIAGVLAVASLAMVIVGVAVAVLNFVEVNDAIRGRW